MILFLDIPLQNLLAIAVATDITFKEAEQVSLSVEMWHILYIPDVLGL